MSTKWHTNEDTILKDALEGGLPLSEFASLLSNRSRHAIRSRANETYGYSSKEIDGDVFFSTRTSTPVPRTRSADESSVTEVLPNNAIVTEKVEDTIDTDDETAILQAICKLRQAGYPVFWCSLGMIVNADKRVCDANT